MAPFWDVIALPGAHVESFKAGRAHLPALPCACMESLRWGEQQQGLPKQPYRANLCAYMEVHKGELAKHLSRITN